MASVGSVLRYTFNGHFYRLPLSRLSSTACPKPSSSTELAETHTDHTGSETTLPSPESPNTPPSVKKEGYGFSELFRSSNFVRSGLVVGKTVPGVITAVVGNNLYVDFGAKFHAVVPRPQKGNKKRWRRGIEVMVKVKDLEQTDHFLGSSRHTSLLEASVELATKQTD